MINFLSYRWLYALISLFVLTLGFISIGMYGYKYSIDFTGGSNINYTLGIEITRDEFAEILEAQSIEYVEVETEGTTVIARTKTIDEVKEQQLREELQVRFSTDVTVNVFETVGPLLGQETINKTIIAVGLAVIGILIFISFTFKRWSFAVSAIIALMHDVLIIAGAYSIFTAFFGAQVDLLFVTAVLTTLSLSVHDTIVTFDRMQENMEINPGKSIEYNANKAITESLVRSFNTSMTLIIMLASLVLLGGTTITFFALALLVGAIAGTYSSPFVAVPFAVFFEKFRKEK